MVWPLAAVLPVPLSEIFWPGSPVVLDGVIWTNAAFAAWTAARAFSMPAPHVAVVHRHSNGVAGSVKLPPEPALSSASGQFPGFGLLPGEEVGNGSALDCRRAMIWPAVRLGMEAFISAATPATMGAAKLVPVCCSLLGLPPELR